MVKWVAGRAVSGSRPALYAPAGIPSKSSKEESEQKTQRPLTEYSTHLWLIHTEIHSHSTNLTSPDSAHTAANVTASNIHISLSAERMEDLDESEQEKERNFQRAALKSLSRTTSKLIERPCVTGNSSKQAQKELCWAAVTHRWTTLQHAIFLVHDGIWVKKMPDRRWTQRGLKLCASYHRTVFDLNIQSLLLQQRQIKAT